VNIARRRQCGGNRHLVALAAGTMAARGVALRSSLAT
jgi:hypothetical protein